MPPAVKEELASGRPDLKKLYQLSRKNGPHQVSGNNDHRTAIYTIIFKGSERTGLQAETDANGKKYCGKSVDVGNRWRYHKLFMSDPNSTGHMYSRTRGADAEILVFTDLTSLPDNIPNAVVQVAEQIAVCMFSTTASVLLSPVALSNGRLAKYVFDHLSAMRFNKIWTEVFSKTGWQPPNGSGLNWKSPMAEFFTGRATWTCEVVTLEDGSTIRVYRGAAKKVQNSVCGDREKKSYITVFRSEFRVPDVKPGSYVTPVIEIYMGEGRRHPFSYAHCPDPGPWSDWEFQNQIGKHSYDARQIRAIDKATGIRFEYQDDQENLLSQWARAGAFHFSGLGYSQADIANLGPGYHHTSDLYLKVQRLRNKLLQVQYDLLPGQTLPTRLRPGQKIIVKELQYNHLKQELRLVTSNLFTSRYLLFAALRITKWSFTICTARV
jgi:hypothetical protein